MTPNQEQKPAMTVEEYEKLLAEKYLGADWQSSQKPTSSQKPAMTKEDEIVILNPKLDKEDYEKLINFLDLNNFNYTIEQAKQTSSIDGWIDPKKLYDDLMKRYNDKRYSIQRRSCYYDLAKDIAFEHGLTPTTEVNDDNQ